MLMFHLRAEGLEKSPGIVNIATLVKNLCFFLIRFRSHNQSRTNFPPWDIFEKFLRQHRDLASLSSCKFKFASLHFCTLASSNPLNFCCTRSWVNAPGWRIASLFPSYSPRPTPELQILILQPPKKIRSICTSELSWDWSFLEWRSEELEPTNNQSQIIHLTDFSKLHHVAFSEV